MELHRRSTRAAAKHDAFVQIGFEGSRALLSISRLTTETSPLSCPLDFALTKG
jgi:hypothetical protein